MVLGIDVGTSSIKVCLLDAETGAQRAVASSPDRELEIRSPQPGFAEQDPRTWWEHTVLAIQKLPNELRAKVTSVGIGYQMHGLVLLDGNGEPVRDAIIWCDSRATPLGEAAFARDPDYCLNRLLNSPGNFTAAKLAWVQAHEPDRLAKAKWAMLPGDYIALRLTGEALTTNSGLSEMILWDFSARERSGRLLENMGLPPNLFPEALPTCAFQGRLRPEIARELGLPAEAAVTFRAGDQPTNALALGAIKPGQVAATAGTSGVIYTVTDQPFIDPRQRVNTFLHVNRAHEDAPYGVLCCINGCGALLSWLRNQLLGPTVTYDEMNQLAAEVPAGSDGLLVLPFGNGAERILANQNVGAHVLGADFPRHGRGHLVRAAQEGVAFALSYGVEGLARPEVIRASKGNLFLSPVFAQTVSDLTGAPVEVVETQGVFGAAWGAAIGAGLAEEPAFAGVAARYTPQPAPELQAAFARWRVEVQTRLAGDPL